MNIYNSEENSNILLLEKSEEAGNIYTESYVILILILIFRVLCREIQQTAVVIQSFRHQEMINLLSHLIKIIVVYEQLAPDTLHGTKKKLSQLCRQSKFLQSLRSFCDENPPAVE